MEENSIHIPVLILCMSPELAYTQSKWNIAALLKIVYYLQENYLLGHLSI